MYPGVSAPQTAFVIHPVTENSHQEKKSNSISTNPNLRPCPTPHPCWAPSGPGDHHAGSRAAGSEWPPERRPCDSDTHTLRQERRDEPRAKDRKRDHVTGGTSERQENVRPTTRPHLEKSSMTQSLVRQGFTRETTEAIRQQEGEQKGRGSGRKQTALQNWKPQQRPGTWAPLSCLGTAGRLEQGTRGSVQR